MPLTNPAGGGSLLGSKTFTKTIDLTGMGLINSKLVSIAGVIRVESLYMNMSPPILPSNATVQFATTPGGNNIAGAVTNAGGILGKGISAFPNATVWNASFLGDPASGYNNGGGPNGQFSAPMFLDASKGIWINVAVAAITQGTLTIIMIYTPLTDGAVPS